MEPPKFKPILLNRPGTQVGRGTCLLIVALYYSLKFIIIILVKIVCQCLNPYLRVVYSIKEFENIASKHTSQYHIITSEHRAIVFILLV